MTSSAGDADRGRVRRLGLGAKTAPASIRVVPTVVLTAIATAAAVVLEPAIVAMIVAAILVAVPAAIPPAATILALVWFVVTIPLVRLAWLTTSPRGEEGIQIGTANTGSGTARRRDKRDDVVAVIGITGTGTVRFDAGTGYGNGTTGYGKRYDGYGNGYGCRGSV
jgi:hypothetical protein